MARKPQQESLMSKGQRRSNREAKKPKQVKAERGAALSSSLAPGPSAGERVPVREHDRTGARNGRR
jgi:hypothetical protein